jgi:hypothetical protein
VRELSGQLPEVVIKRLREVQKTIMKMPHAPDAPDA